MSQPIKVDFDFLFNWANIFLVVVLVRLREVTVLCCSLKLFVFNFGGRLPFTRILRSSSI